MNEVEMNKDVKLSPHFTLGELTKTSYITADGNIPSHVAIENLKRLCGWLEILRERYNQKYGEDLLLGTGPGKGLDLCRGQSPVGGRTSPS